MTILKNTKHVILLLLMGLIGMGICRAQDLVVGTIVEPEQRQPIANAQICLMHTSDSSQVRTATSDDQGWFKIKNDTRPTYLMIVAQGYDTLYIGVPSTRDQGPTGLGKLEMGTLVLPLHLPEPKHDLCTRIRQWWHKHFSK